MQSQGRCAHYSTCLHGGWYNLLLETTPSLLNLDPTLRRRRSLLLVLLLLLVVLLPRGRRRGRVSEQDVQREGRCARWAVRVGQPGLGAVWRHCPGRGLRPVPVPVPFAQMRGSSALDAPPPLRCAPLPNPHLVFLALLLLALLVLLLVLLLFLLVLLLFLLALLLLLLLVLPGVGGGIGAGVVGAGVIGAGVWAATGAGGCGGLRLSLAPAPATACTPSAAGNDVRARQGVHAVACLAAARHEPHRRPSPSQAPTSFSCSSFFFLYSFFCLWSSSCGGLSGFGGAGAKDRCLEVQQVAGELKRGS